MSNSKKLTLGQFRELTKNLSDEIPIYYHAYDKGCCLNSYAESDIWFFPKGQPTKAIVINPGEDYDSRKPTKVN